MNVLMLRSTGRIEKVSDNPKYLGAILYKVNAKSGTKTLTSQQTYAIAKAFLNKGKGATLTFCNRLFTIE